VGWGENGVH